MLNFKKEKSIFLLKSTLITKLKTIHWGKTNRDQKKGLEFGRKEYDQLDKFCKKEKIGWFASAWDKNSLNFLKDINLNRFKLLQL